MSKKNEYKIKVSYTFTGTFTIVADNRQQAKEYAEKHCGLTIGGDVHSTLNDEDVNWEFPVHPETKIHR